MTTAYDRVSYPSVIWEPSHPERLAVLARMAGLDPVAPARARILEVGGGDCLNLLALAAAYPQCDAHGFDLSASAIARGTALLESAGLSNVTLVEEDILRARRRYPARSFDYVIVHGVYAWVPAQVRAAIIALIAHTLSDRGVAFVSYNSMPGGHVRLIMREMLLNEVGSIEDPEEKIAETRRFLEEYAQPGENDGPLIQSLRQSAASMLRRPDSVLFHDELGEHYHPQRLVDVVCAGEAHGLRHLTDAGVNLHLHGFLPDGETAAPDSDEQVLRAAVRNDYLNARYFRQTTFVRAEQPLDRQIDAGRIADLHVSTKLCRQEDKSFTYKKDVIEIADEELAEAIEYAARLYPQRVPVAEVARTPLQLRILLQLFNEWYVNLHVAPAPFAAKPGVHPRTSSLVRGMFGMGEHRICTLNHALLDIEQPALQRLLMAADGTRSLAEIAGLDHGIPRDEVEAALTGAAERALLAA